MVKLEESHIQHVNNKRAKIETKELRQLNTALFMKSMYLFGRDRIQISYRGLETSSLAGLTPGYFRSFCNCLLDHS
jgi:hypothetical protein